MTLLQRWRQTALHNKALVITSVLVAFGTLFYSASAVFQVWLMHKSAKDSSEQVEKLVSATNAAIKATIDGSRESIDKALSQNRAALDAQSEQNAAALSVTSRQAQRTFDANIRDSFLRERPLVMMRGYALTSDGVTATQITEGVRVSVVHEVINTGDTPAFDAAYQSRVFFDQHESPRPMTQFHDNNFAQSLGFIPPRAIISVRVQTEAVIPTGDQYAAYRVGLLDLRVHTSVAYTDSDHYWHWSTGCMFLHVGNVFQVCPGNDIDRSQKGLPRP